MTWRCSSCEHQNLGRHKSCQHCGDPKDKSEPYEMPANPATAVSVTEVGLLRMAEAGANWRCAYCGSDQRNLDATCAQCGASSAEGTSTQEARTVSKLTAWMRLARWARKHRLGLGITGAVLATIVGIWMYAHRTRTFTAKVTDATWTQTISVQRYQIWARDGWRDTQPTDAFEVVSNGQQVHHYDDVLDGYDTQHYTEQVACGEDCYDEPQRCSESCSDNGNGFASCQTECTGGGRRCTTRYCSEARTRQVARYRKEPRYAEAISYKIWDWGFHRSVDATGTGAAGMRWPVEEARVGEGLGPREEERETRSGRYVVTVAYDGTSRLVFEVAADELARFELGSRHELRLKRGEATTVDGKVVTLASGG